MKKNFSRLAIVTAVTLCISVTAHATNNGNGNGGNNNGPTITHGGGDAKAEASAIGVGVGMGGTGQGGAGGSAAQSQGQQATGGAANAAGGAGGSSAATGNGAGNTTTVRTGDYNAASSTAYAPQVPTVLRSCRLYIGLGGASRDGSGSGGIPIGNDATCLADSQIELMAKVNKLAPGMFSTADILQAACKVEGMDATAACKAASK